MSAFMSSAFDSFAHDISQTRALFNQYLTAQLEMRGYRCLAPSHGDILAKLFEEGETSMSELSRRIGRDPSTVTALVKKLVGMGLATTRKSSVDRRSTTVALTPEGRALQQDFEEISRNLRLLWRQGVDDDDLACAQRVLAQVQANIRAALAQEGTCASTSATTKAGNAS